MRKTTTAIVLSLFAVTGAYAASASAASTMTPQQRMKACAPLSKGMHKKERSAFMSKCLTKATHAAAVKERKATLKAAGHKKEKTSKKK